MTNCQLPTTISNDVDIMQIKIFNSRKLNETREFNLNLATSNQKGECAIGRSPTSSLVLDSADVSRLHGKFFQQNGNYFFTDLGSRNGSVINGKLAEINQIYPLKPGDIVRIGEFVLILEETDVLRPDLAEKVFASADKNASATRELADNIPSTTIASTREILFPTATTEDRNEIAAAISAENTVIQTETSAIATAAETCIQIPQPLAEATFIQPVLDCSQAEVDVFAFSENLTEAEKIAIGDRPTHIEAFDEVPQFSNPDASDLFASEERDRLAISNKKEVDPILDLDPWQDLESETEIAPALTQNPAVVEKKAMANPALTMATEKYIALMAHPRQKTQLTRFVTQHQAFFSQHLTIATPTTSASLQQAGLEVTAETPALPIGGYQAIADLANSGKVSAVILLEDVLQLPQSEHENQEALVRSCHLNQVLLATNLATAEAVLCYLKSGNGRSVICH
jgi:methylglyoxal synthase/pSer/pThr/pTyr-binding forkhead associated (FHA) protein